MIDFTPYWQEYHICLGCGKLWDREPYNDEIWCDICGTENKHLLVPTLCKFEGMTYFTARIQTTRNTPFSILNFKTWSAYDKVVQIKEEYGDEVKIFNLPYDDKIIERIIKHERPNLFEDGWKLKKKKVTYINQEL